MTILLGFVSVSKENKKRNGGLIEYMLPVV